MTEMILGLVGFTLGAVCAVAGYDLGARTPRAAVTDTPRTDGGGHRAAEDEIRALRALTGYSADIAYGLAEFPEEDEL